MSDDARRVQELSQMSAAELRKALSTLDEQCVAAREGDYTHPPAFYDNKARLTAALELRLRRDVQGGGSASAPAPGRTLTTVVPFTARPGKAR